MRTFFAATAVVLVGVSIAAQSRGSAAQTSAPSDAATLAAGWNALASGQGAVAARSAGQVLARTPWSHAAIALQIEALAQSDPIKGLDAYEAWLGRRAGDDAGLLEPVPRAILLQLANSGEADVRQSARRMLRDAGVPL